MEIHRARTSHGFSFSQIGKEVINTSFNVKHSNLTIDNRSITPELILSAHTSEIRNPYKKKRIPKIVQVNNTYNNNITIIHQECPKPSEFLNLKKESIKKLKKSILKHKAINHTQIKIVKFKPEKLISEYEYNGETGTENLTQRSHHSAKSEKHHQMQQTALTISQVVNDVNIDELKEQIDLVKKCIYDKKLGIFFGFCAFAFKNAQKKNHDKLSIFINKNIISPQSGKLSLNYFSVYHGINGESVSSYLKDNFHKFLFSQRSLSTDSIYTLFSAFEHFDEEILKSSVASKCGSTTLSLLSLNNQIYISNLGCSKCIISLNNSFEIYSVNNTHTPRNEREMQRLRYYDVVFKKDIKSKGKKFIILPYNIHSTRIVGCPERNKNAILGYPEITHIDTVKNQKIDFFIIVNDTISFFLNNKEIILLCYTSIKESLEYKLSYGKLLDNIVSQISKEAVTRGAKGNLSVIIIDNGTLTKLHKENSIKKVTEIIAQLEASVMDFEDLFTQCETFDEKWYENEKKERNVNKTNSMSKYIENNNNIEDVKNSITKLIECNNEPILSSNKNDDRESKAKKKKKKISFCSCFL